MSIPTLVAWNLENSPLPSRIDWGVGAGLERTDIELAVLGLKKFLPTRDLELKQLFVTGWSEHGHLLENMKRIEDIDRVLCSPVVAKDGGEEADDKIVLEMVRFIGNYPNGAIVLISEDEDFSKFCQYLRREGTPLYILVVDRETVPVVLKNCALDVWEWKDFPHEA